MVHCKIYKCDIRYMGWVNHVGAHKHEFEFIHGRLPKTGRKFSADI